MNIIPALSIFSSSSFFNIRASLVAQLVKNLPAMQERPGFDPWVGKTPGDGKGYPLQYSGLENSTDYSMALQRI